MTIFEAHLARHHAANRIPPAGCFVAGQELATAAEIVVAVRAQDGLIDILHPAVLDQQAVLFRKT
jgi:hypothetical protein